MPDRRQQREAGKFVIPHQNPIDQQFDIACILAAQLRQHDGIEQADHLLHAAVGLHDALRAAAAAHANELIFCGKGHHVHRLDWQRLWQEATKIDHGRQRPECQFPVWSRGRDKIAGRRSCGGRSGKTGQQGTSAQRNDCRRIQAAYPHRLWLCATLLATGAAMLSQTALVRSMPIHLYQQVGHLKKIGNTYFDKACRAM